MKWMPEAEEDIKKVPFFVRKRVRARVEKEANKAGKQAVSLADVKATQARSVGLYAEPDYLIVLGLNRDGSAEEIFNGPGALAWNAAGKMQKTGQRPIGVTKLRGLMGGVAEADRLPAR